MFAYNRWLNSYNRLEMPLADSRLWYLSFMDMVASGFIFWVSYGCSSKYVVLILRWPTALVLFSLFFCLHVGHFRLCDYMHFCFFWSGFAFSNFVQNVTCQIKKIVGSMLITWIPLFLIWCCFGLLDSSWIGNLWVEQFFLNWTVDLICNLWFLPCNYNFSKTVSMQISIFP